MPDFRTKGGVRPNATRRPPFDQKGAVLLALPQPAQ
jgi:hypothetical protein